MKKTELTEIGVIGGAILILIFILWRAWPGLDEAPSIVTSNNESNNGSPELSSAPTANKTTMNKTWPAPTILSDDQIVDKQVRIKTEKGDIVMKFYPDTAPLTVSNFIGLVQGGFYNGLIFHRREEGFVIQGGDPNGTGTGGPGYQFKDELKDSRTYVRGTVAMANSGPNTNGSQFFIMLDDVSLPHLYSIFGLVTQGMDVVDRITVGDKMLSVTAESL